MDKTQETPSPEELNAEQEALKETKEDEVRANIISELGLDELEDAERIDKLVAREMKHSETLSQAIGQKIKYRTERDEWKGKVKPAEPTPTPAPTPKEVDVDAKVLSILEKRDLEAMDYPDDIKTEIQRVAQIQGISVKKAVSDPYIQAKVQIYEKEKETDESSNTRKNRAGGKKEFSEDNPPEVDMTTKEGKEEYEAWYQAMKKKYPA